LSIIEEEIYNKSICFIEKIENDRMVNMPGSSVNNNFYFVNRDGTQTYTPNDTNFVVTTDNDGGNSDGSVVYTVSYNNGGGMTIDASTLNLSNWVSSPIIENNKKECKSEKVSVTMPKRKEYRTLNRFDILDI